VREEKKRGRSLWMRQRRSEGDREGEENEEEEKNGVEGTTHTTKTYPHIDVALKGILSLL
jgi:hypothetical protein